ncbi:DUF4190 domain-containing protein [Curtobacterium sp. MCLR17_042]|uniref:DUF4190 domain-containing protein n=1 Tax=Curtobacterium sp. MCLR17_042 TaxID=2175626 RepID=UPI000DA96EF8|nr:DUF4190 domain-containing protein [Curtobacterium sp. MCLR17_042]PZE29153.1 hypothetical protein DEJ02_07240 [Curtobacterium sp. MCLR17_042]
MQDEQTYVDPPRDSGRHLNELAVLAFILAFFVNIVGLILGILALRQIARSGERGRKLAIASIVVGGVLALAFFGGAFLVFSSVLSQHGCTYPC